MSNKDELLDPSKLDGEDVAPKKVVRKKKSDLVERSDKRVYTEDGKELLN